MIEGINKFNAISGTSIGAINGYFIFTDNVEKLEEIWININTNIKNNIKIVNNTVDNSNLIDILSKLMIIIQKKLISMLII